MDAFLGEIRMFAGSFAPEGWLYCDGQTLPINQYQALYSLLGNTFGGDNRTNFCLPDFRGRVPIHRGQGIGLSPHNIGQATGSETVTLTATQIPAHSHSINASSVAANLAPAAGNLIASSAANAHNFVAPTAAVVTLAPNTVGNTGGSQAHSNIQPSLVVGFIMCCSGGNYPPRAN